MEQTFANLIEEAGREGRRRYARWDADLYQTLCGGPVRKLWQRLQGRAQAAAVFAGYLELVREALGAGYILPPKEAGEPGRVGWANFLAFCLVRLIPERLAAVADDQQLPLLAKVWNLGEGLLQEPAWVDRFVLAGAGELARLEDIETFLERMLEPALTPAPPAAWQGPFGLSVLDARPLYDEFLPGEMYLAAPTVLCVRDRRRPDLYLGVFLRPQGRSQFLGLTSSLDAYTDGGELPPVRWAERRALIGERAVDMPFLRRPHRHLLTRSGFLVASAVDSQRLWVVESP
jgi:hypothetical protein